MLLTELYHRFTFHIYFSKIACSTCNFNPFVRQSLCFDSSSSVLSSGGGKDTISKCPIDMKTNIEMRCIYRLFHGFVLYFPDIFPIDPAFPKGRQVRGKYRVEGENIREIQDKAMLKHAYPMSTRSFQEISSQNSSWQLVWSFEKCQPGLSNVGRSTSSRCWWPTLHWRELLSQKIIMWASGDVIKHKLQFFTWNFHVTWWWHHPQSRTMISK